MRLFGCNGSSSGAAERASDDCSFPSSQLIANSCADRGTQTTAHRSIDGGISARKWARKE